MARDAHWWALLGPPARGVLAVVLIALGCALLAGHLRLWRTTVDDRAGQDFGIFLASVRHALAGRSLYAPTPLRSRTGGTGTSPLNLNLPHTNLIVWPLAVLPDRVALVTWVAAGLALLVASSAAAVRALGWRLRWLPTLGALVYLLAWAPSAAFTLTAQVSFVLMLPVTAAWLAHRRERFVAAGAWLGLAAAMKPFLLVFLPYFALRREWRALSAMAFAIAAVFAVGAACFGLAAYGEWLAQLPRIAWSAHYFNASFVGVLQRSLGRSAYGVFANAPDLVLPLAAILSCAAGLVTFRVLMRARPARVDGDWAALLMAALLISPLGWNYYLWMALWPAAGLIAAERPWRDPRLADVWLLAGLAGWLWWGKMTLWGQPEPLATLTFGSMYFWALLSLWTWTLLTLRRSRRAPSAS
jgi:hypothetical protein